MRCRRLDLQKKMAVYIDGELSPDSVRSLEDHLAECESCQIRLNRVLEGSRLAGELKPVSPSRDLWPAIEASMQQSKMARGSRRRISMKTAAAGAIGLSLAILVILVLPYGLLQLGKWESPEVFNTSSFHIIPLHDFDENAEPHVATEGYVSDVHMDKEEGNFRFKLVDDLHRPSHFVVCEIINPLNLQVPSQGSRIRVYGVSRYDSKAHHQWYEVHPVLNIEPVR